jgi:hypothetical protein
MPRLAKLSGKKKPAPLHPDDLAAFLAEEAAEA